ncbi:MAG: His Kinase (phospho-acceptor) protein, partial [Verrucomicrobiales bacterium]|nr:His Kinase (phospho-acceptor) protein [Verrucomicrobiales bacterium]
SEWIPDLATYPAFTRSAEAARCGLGSTLALPFFNGGEFQGMMEFFHPVIEEPDETLLQTLDGICNQIGQFIVRKKAESELIRSKNAAESANRAKSDFLATMSHEIRTPMNGVLGFTQLLQQSPLSSQQNEFVSAIRSSAEALLTVINDVLDFSKIESGRMDLDSHPFSLQSCLEEALETVSTSAAEKQLDLAARLGADVPASVIGDGLRLRQVLVNLLGNAVKFTLQGEVQLNVSTFPTHSENVGLEFSVRDSGIGIPTDQMQTLFQPFRQGDSSISRCFGGTGLGLAICRRLVELMGGTISATSIPGEGSVFFFRLEFAASATPPPLVNPASFPSLAGRRALVVDGHHLSREAIVEILGRWGLEARASASPDLAADVVREWKPDVLLLDSACTDPAGVSFAKNLSEQGTALFVMCQPTDGRTVRERFDGEIAGTLFKPMKVSPLFNALLAHHDQKDSRTPGSHRPLIPVQTRTRPLRLLLAEDNAINRKLALAALSQMGCTADVAVDGHEALRAAKATRYDAILMDVQMPGMDGLESTQYIRQWEAQTGTPRTRIIALTANALSGDREICLQAGMDDYLSKPIRLEALRATLQQVCDDSPTEAARSVPVEPMTAPSAATLALQQLAGELSASDAAALAADFLDDLPNQLQAIRASLLAGNAEESKRHAHSLKGTSSIFRLEGLQRASDAVETASRENRLTDATAAFALLEAASTAAVRDLRNAVSALAATAVLQPMS